MVGKLIRYMVVYPSYSTQKTILNPEKCSFILLGVDDLLQTNLVWGDEILKNTKQEKVLGVTLDNKLTFATHLLIITENANKKFNALT